MVDEYGHSVGIVTRADALRAIRSDHAADADEDPMIVRREDGLLPRRGRPADRHADGDHPAAAAARRRTITRSRDWCCTSLRRMPKVGERVTVGEWQIEVVDLDRRRIDQVLMTRVG